MKKGIFLMMVFCLLFSSACGKSEDIPGNGEFYIYYINQTKRELFPVMTEINQDLDIDTLVVSIWNRLASPTDSALYRSPVAEDMVVLKDHTFEDGILIMNFDDSYLLLDPVSEILLRAAIVRTFTQFDQIAAVEIKTDSQPLLDMKGIAYGAMRRNDFVDVIGRGVNAYTRANVTFYFSDESGERLAAEQREIAYANSYSLEQMVMNRLIQGPSEDSGLYATISPNTSLISVTTNNGVCTVNIDDEILKNTVNVRPAVTIYSIVNTLTELNGITSVQILINGSSSVSFMDEISLATPLNRNLDYISGGEKTE